jgi:hypothetical protein
MEPRVTFRPSVQEDVIAFLGRPLQYQATCVTLLKGDTILGIGGVACSPEHRVFVAFMHLSDEARKHPVALYKATVFGMQMVRRAGIRRIVAEAAPCVEGAERFLQRFGFHYVRDGVYLCSD